MEITSVSNPQIKNIIKLRKSSERKKQNLIIIEGNHEIEIAIEAGLQFANLFYSDSRNKKNLKIPASLKDKTTNVANNVFDKISYRENPDGFLATAIMPKINLDKIKLSKNPLVVVLEGVEKPGNLGAISRTADAAGADALIVSGPKTDIYNPNAIRSSLGTIFTNQVSHGNNAQVIEWLKKNKIKIFATTPETKTDYIKCNFTKPTAIIIGTEHEGLSKEWLEAADEKIKIKMNGKIDSLNASVSAGIVLFEAKRQRKT